MPALHCQSKVINVLFSFLPVLDVVDWPLGKEWNRKLKGSPYQFKKESGHDHFPELPDCREHQGLPPSISCVVVIVSLLEFSFNLGNVLFVRFLILVDLRNANFLFLNDKVIKRPSPWFVQALPEGGVVVPLTFGKNHLFSLIFV